MPRIAWYSPKKAMACVAGNSPSGCVAATWSTPIVATHEWLIEKEQFAWGVRLASALIPFWEARALLTEGREWMHRLLQLPRAVQEPSWRAKALGHCCFLIHLQGDMSAYLPLQAEAREAMSQLEDRRSIAQIARVSASSWPNSGGTMRRGHWSRTASRFGARSAT